MKSTLTSLEINGINSQSNTNLKKNSSQAAINSFTQSSSFNADSSKMFQRKPSFKMFQRKQKKGIEDQTKICYISPQKSGIFKRYSALNNESQSGLNSSFFTNNSNQISYFQTNKSCLKPNNSQNNINQTRSVFHEKSNQNAQDGFQTPKHSHKCININSSKSTLFKKMSTKNLRNQEFILHENRKQGNLNNKENQFDKDFDILLQINDLQSPISSNSNSNYLRKGSQKFFKNNFYHKDQKQKQNYFENQCQDENKDLKFQIEEFQIQTQSLKRKINKLEGQKSQIQESSKLFLDEIKNLQNKNQNLQNQKQKYKRQKGFLQQNLKQVSQSVHYLKCQVKQLEQFKKISLATAQHNEFNSQHFKSQYFKLNQQYKYLFVQNNILKKQLEQKKQDQGKIQKLELVNKKISAKNKYLTKQLQKLQDKIDCKKQDKFNNLLLKSNKTIQNQKDFKPALLPVRKSLQGEGHIKIKQRHASSLLVFNEDDQKNQFLQNMQNLSVISNGSSLQLSLQLSPEKADVNSKAIKNANQGRNSSINRFSTQRK